MSRIGVKRAINSSTTRKTRSSGSQQQQVSNTKASASAPSAASLAKKRHESANKAKASKGSRRAAGPLKGKDEDERARVDGELQRLAGREGKGIRVGKDRPQADLRQTQRPRVDAALTQTFEGLMK